MYSVNDIIIKDLNETVLTLQVNGEDLEVKINLIGKYIRKNIEIKDTLYQLQTL